MLRTAVLVDNSSVCTTSNTAVTRVHVPMARSRYRTNLRARSRVGAAGVLSGNFGRFIAFAAIAAMMVSRSMLNTAAQLLDEGAGCSAC